MATNIDAVAPVPLDDPAAREKSSGLPWLSVALVFLAAIMLRQMVALNTDVGWLLTVGERVPMTCFPPIGRS